MSPMEAILAPCRPLIDLGAALHWLRVKGKAPASDEWSSAPRYTLAQLMQKYHTDANIGIRLGEPSKTDHGYIQVLDIDIRDADQADDAWEKVRELVPNVDELPMVVSGSGGESRHVYFFSEKPLKSRKLFKSDGFSMVFDPRLGREVKKNDWEIDLFGTGKQVVLPPSIHPDTGLPYRWEREFDWLMLDLGIAPVVSTESWGVFTSDEAEDDEDDLFSIVRAEPLDLTEDEIDGYLADLPEELVEDRDGWLMVGSALSHQHQGGAIGFEKWCDWSKQSDKFNMRDQKAVWKSFKGAKNPVTFRSVIQAAQENRLQHNLPTVYVEPDPLDELLGDMLPSVKVNPIADWTSLMARNEDGAPTGGLHNTHLISKYDPRLWGCVAFSFFHQEIVNVNKPKIAHRDREHVKKPMIQLDGPHWDVPDPVNGTPFADAHLNDIRRMIEAPKTQGGYGIKIADRDLKAAIDIVARENSFHPVKNYLEGAARHYDGLKRVETLFIKYLGCADTPYHREAARLMILGAVARIYEPGHKFDFVPILEGLQGKRKSTFIRVLGRGWSSELSGDFHDNKEMVEQILGNWIVEIPELQGFSKADTNVLKAWLSRTHDKTRLAYRTYAATYPRQCIFIGSTNDDEYLRDHTGGRRFWPIQCNLPGDQEIDTDGLEAEIDHIWAEGYLMYRAMRETCKLRELPLYMRSDEAKAEAKALQESRRVETSEDSLAGEIEKWLNDPIGTDSGFDDLDADAPKVYRNATCVIEIWKDMMGKGSTPMPQQEGAKIGRAMARIEGWVRISQVTTKRFGRQRVYVREGSRFESDF